MSEPYRFLLLTLLLSRQLARVSGFNHIGDRCGESDKYIYHMYLQGRICCEAVNCPIGTQPVPCTMFKGKATCRSCENGRIQRDEVASHYEKRCLKTSICNKLIVDNGESSCNYRVGCRPNDDDQGVCDGPRTCAPGLEMSLDGLCRPCVAGYYKTMTSYGPCQPWSFTFTLQQCQSRGGTFNEGTTVSDSSCMLDGEPITPGAFTSKGVTTEDKPTLPGPSTTQDDRDLFTKDGEVPQSDNSRESPPSNTPIIVAVIAVVIVTAVVAVSLVYLLRKTKTKKKGDEEVALKETPPSSQASNEDIAAQSNEDIPPPARLHVAAENQRLLNDEHQCAVVDPASYQLQLNNNQECRPDASAPPPPYTADRRSSPAKNGQNTPSVANVSLNLTLVLGLGVTPTPAPPSPVPTTIGIPATDDEKSSAPVDPDCAQTLDSCSQPFQAVANGRDEKCANEKHVRPTSPGIHAFPQDSKPMQADQEEETSVKST